LQSAVAGRRVRPDGVRTAQSRERYPRGPARSVRALFRSEGVTARQRAQIDSPAGGTSASLSTPFLAALTQKDTTPPDRHVEAALQLMGRCPSLTHPGRRIVIESIVRIARSQQVASRLRGGFLTSRGCIFASQLVRWPREDFPRPVIGLTDFQADPPPLTVKAVNPGRRPPLGTRSAVAFAAQSEPPGTCVLNISL